MSERERERECIELDYLFIKSFLSAGDPARFPTFKSDTKLENVSAAAFRLDYLPRHGEPCVCVCVCVCGYPKSAS